jgi:hypothetical protein
MVTALVRAPDELRAAVTVTVADAEPLAGVRLSHAAPTLVVQEQPGELVIVIGADPPFLENDNDCFDNVKVQVAPACETATGLPATVNDPDRAVAPLAVAVIVTVAGPLPDDALGVSHA